MLHEAPEFTSEFEVKRKHSRLCPAFPHAWMTRPVRALWKGALAGPASPVHGAPGTREGAWPPSTRAAAGGAAVRPRPGWPCGESSVLVAAQPVALAAPLVREARVGVSRGSKNHPSRQVWGSDGALGQACPLSGPAQPRRRTCSAPGSQAVPGGVELPSRDSGP